MGVYDEVRFSGQVKCWGQLMKGYTLGSKVPSIGESTTYSVLMKRHDGGGALNVHNGKLVSWTLFPTFMVVFDKYGDVVNNWMQLQENLDY